MPPPKGGVVGVGSGVTVAVGVGVSVGVGVNVGGMMGVGVGISEPASGAISSGKGTYKVYAWFVRHSGAPFGLLSWMSIKIR